MSSLTTPSVPTWRSLLPWLDRMSAKQVLSLQALGGRAQWWMHEGPTETAVRRHDQMDDILENLSLILAARPFLSEPLSELLPTLPSGKATSSLDLSPQTLGALQAFIGPTLSSLRDTNPIDILWMRNIEYEKRQEIIVELVRAAVLPEVRGASPVSGRDERQGANLPPSTWDQSEAAEPWRIRAWATANGYVISERGRLSAAIREAYEAAQPRSSEPPAPQAAASLAQGHSHAEPGSLPPGATLRAEAITSWFAGLDNRQQALIALHLCAAKPYSIDDLATEHRTMRARMAELLSELPERFDAVAAQNGALRNAMIVLNQATSRPITRDELLEQHPWLGVIVPGTDVTVLQMLLAVRWSGSMEQGWLYSDSLEDARQLTRQTLGLAPGECLSVAAATRLLAKTGSRLTPTEAWLGFCGFSLESNQLQLAQEMPVVRSGGRHARRENDDYELAPPKQLEDASTPVDTPGAAPVEEQHAAETVHGEFANALRQLHVFVSGSQREMRLVDVLSSCDQLPEEIRALATRFLAATAGPTGWILPAKAVDVRILQRAVVPLTDEAQADEEASAELESLADEVAALLRGASVPMSSSEILSALPTAGTLDAVVDVLFNDARLAITGAGGWTYSPQSDELAEPTLPAELSTSAAGALRGPLKDRAWEILEGLGHPLTSPLLAERMGTDVNLRSLKTQLQGDRRFMRSDVDSWALSEWDLRPYTTIKELVGQEVTRAGGEIPTDDLIKILTREFSINESSVRQVASTPPFTARGGSVRQLRDGVWPAEVSTTPPSDPTLPDTDEGPSANDLIDLMGLS